MAKSAVEASAESTLGKSLYCVRNGQICDATGEPLALRAKSAQMLSFLLEQRGMVLSKDVLAKAVWPQTVATDESISKCISEIRKVIGDDSHSILETFPKRGYKINTTYEEIPPLPQSTGLNPTNLKWVLLVIAVLVMLIFYWQSSHEPAVQESSQAVIVDPSTDEMERGRKALGSFTYADNLVAERHFRNAVEQDPQNGLAYAELAAAIAIRLENGWAVLTGADEERAFFYAQKAIELNPELWLAHYALGRLHAVVSDSNLELASLHLQDAMSLRPANDDARVYFAAVKIFQGAQDESIPIHEAALASHPAPPFWYFLSYGNALFQAKRYEEAVAPLATCLVQMPTAPYCLRFQIANFAQLGQIEDAEWAAEEYMALGHDATVSAIMRVIKTQDEPGRKHFIEAYRKAGLPE